jgi:hypothetical protein
MNLASVDESGLVRLVAPVVAVVPQLWQTIALLRERIAQLEVECEAERNRRIEAEDAKADAEREAQRLYEETLRLEAKLP